MQSTDYIDFRQYWFILKRRWLPAAAVFGSVIVLTTLSTLLQKPVYQAKGRLLIKTPNDIASAIGKDESSAQEIRQIGELSAVGSNSDPMKTQIGIINSPSIAQKIIEALKLELKPEELLEQISVKSIEETDILEVSYESTDSEEAALAVNQLMNLYLEDNLLANRTEAAAAHKFVARQLPITEANVRQAEVILRKFKEENNIVALDKEAESAVEVIANLENKITDAQDELVDANAQSETLRNQLNMNSQAAVAASSLGQSPSVQKALEELQKVESELAIERTRYQETHPTIALMKSRRESLKALLQDRVKQVVGGQKQADGNFQTGDGEVKQELTANLVRAEAGRLSAARRVSALSNVLASYKGRVNAMPRLEQRQRQLELELEAAQSTYRTLLRRLEEIRVEENRNMGNARILEKAQVPEKSVAPNIVKNLALGSLMGVLLSVGIAFILEALDTSIKTLKEARELFGYTLLGIIPFYGKSGKNTLRAADPEQSAPKLVVRDIPRSPMCEAYRMLQANLSFLSSDKELKAIVVTSAVPKEGKSTVSANLAVAMAQLGRKVLLVDADMHRPLQHQIWNLLNDAGLSHFLVGQAEPRTVIKEVMANLHVLTAGVVPPNPMVLLNSKRMTSLIEKFSDNYDFVIIDTPALSIAVDALVLGKMVDGVLLVVRPGVVDSASAASTKEFLEQSGQNILGQVVNGVSHENKPYSYYAKEYYAEENSTTRENVALESRRNANRP